MITITIRVSANSDLRKAIIESMSHPRFPRSPAVLMDTRLAIEENPSPDQLRQRAGWIATLLSRREGSRCALVVGSRPHEYGLGRMFSVFLATEGVNSEVFTTIREARTWLPAKEPKVDGGA